MATTRAVAPLPAGKATETKLGSGPLFQKLASKELVLGLSGPLGSGVSEIGNTLTGLLKNHGYEVVKIKVSSLIRAYAQYLRVPPAHDFLSLEPSQERYVRFQDIGNKLRAERGNDFLAYLVATHISIDRTKRHSGQDPRAITPGRIAYLVDQLKHPDECQLLRAVYKDNFFLLGVLCGGDARKRRLQAEGIRSEDAERLMERDRRQDEQYGQKLEKTLQLADFFVRNAKSNTAELATSIGRFVKLVHGSTEVYPTRLEQGMYAAYSAALASACLSRQVGAAILDRNGVLIATGCNDVPKGGGGLYQQGEGEDDRCAFIQGGVCFNHLEKDAIRIEVEKAIRDELDRASEEGESSSDSERNAKLAARLAKKIRAETRLNDLIEFSRAVHAEMDALVSLARSGGGRAQDGTLFTTTYPCHNCARHIVAAGIRAVYFVEPYEKSLAVKLHSDAIEHDTTEEPLARWDAEASTKRRVKFLHFEGVAPRRYLDLFAANADRKNNTTGRAESVGGSEARKKQSQLLESYIEIEARLAQALESNGISVQKIQ